MEALKEENEKLKHQLSIRDEQFHEASVLADRFHEERDGWRAVAEKLAAELRSAPQTAMSKMILAEFYDLKGSGG